MTTENPYINAAREAVESAAAACAVIREHTLGSTTKDDRTPVTAADYAAQILIIHSLRRAFPAIPVVAEEDLSLLNTDSHRQIRTIVNDTIRAIDDSLPVAEIIDTFRTHNAPEAWIVDPIDGTRGYISGDHYAIAVALKQNDKITAGVLGCPTYKGGMLLHAAAGSGAYRVCGRTSEKIVLANAAPRYTQSPSNCHSDFALHAKIGAACGLDSGILTLDSQLKYAAVAMGEASAYFRIPAALTGVREKIWDHAAGYIIIKEAGGCVSDRDGNELDFSQSTMRTDCGVIAAERGCHRKALDYLLGIRGRA